MSGLIQLNFFVARSVYSALTHVGAYLHKNITSPDIDTKELICNLEDRVKQTSEKLVASLDNNGVQEDDITPIEDSQLHVDMLRLRSQLSSMPKPQFKPPSINDAFLKKETMTTQRKKTDKYVKLNSTYTCRSKISSRGTSTLESIEEPSNIIEDIEEDQDTDARNKKEQVTTQQMSEEEVVINYFDPAMSQDNFYISSKSSNVNLTSPKAELEPSYVLDESWLPLLKLKRIDGVHNMADDEPESLTHRYVQSGDDLSPVTSRTSVAWWMC